ncbi:MAG: response regulator [Actinomycetota bacterium]
MVEGARKIKVLLADEQILFREAARVVIESEPDLEVVAEVGDGLSAASEAERTRPDVAFLSVDLPGCDGIRAAALIRERTGSCGVVVLAPDDDFQTLIASLEAGVGGFLTKDCALTELIEAARAVSRGETLIPRQMLGPLLARLIRRRRQQDEALTMIERLTRREREILALLAQGADNQTIAQQLVISPETARTHIQKVLGKLRVHSRLEAAAFVMKHGLLEELTGVVATEPVRSGPVLTAR